MIGTDQPRRGAVLRRTDSRAAMPAGIVEGAQAAVAVAHHDDRILADLHRQVVPGIQHFAVVTHEQPVAVPNHLQIDLIILRAAIEVSLQGGLEISSPQIGSAWCRAQSWWFPENPGCAYDNNIPFSRSAPKRRFLRIIRQRDVCYARLFAASAAACNHDRADTTADLRGKPSPSARGAARRPRRYRRALAARARGTVPGRG